MKPTLKLDWCSHAAARYAVLHWHYSKAMPAGKLVKVGVWEDDAFVGVVIFSCGASPPFYKWCERVLGVGKFEACELTRIALRDHATSVTRIMSIATKFLKTKCPGLRVVVSFADQDQGHHGGIYQGGNWTYTGVSTSALRFLINGSAMHIRTLGSKGVPATLAGARRLDPQAVVLPSEGKHKYLFALDKGLRDRIKLLAKPYPKRVRSVDSDTSANHAGKGGATPTRTLE